MPHEEKIPGWSWGASNSVIIILFLFLYVLLMEYLGYAASTLLFGVLLMVRLKVAFFRALTVTALTVIFIVSIFGQIFHIQLPAGLTGLPW